MKNPEDKTTERRENSQDFQMLPLKYSLMRTDQCIYVRKPEARGKKKKQLKRLETIGVLVERSRNSVFSNQPKWKMS